jgi:heme-degrading monooxygenase HmoA
MIARVWRGVTPAEKADAYLDYLQETGLKEYRATEGNLSAQVWRRIVDDRAEFLTVTLWDSYDAVHRFAGVDIDKPVYYPADGEYLVGFEPAVDHYEVVAGA